MTVSTGGNEPQLLRHEGFKDSAAGALLKCHLITSQAEGRMREPRRTPRAGTTLYMCSDVLN